MRIALCLVLLSGCFVMPSSSTTSRNVGREAAPDIKKGLARGLTLKTRVDHGDVVVSAIRTRDCHREFFDLIEVTEHRGMRLGGAKDPRGRAFGAILAPVTIPVSFLITSVALAVGDDKHHLQRTPHHVETWACQEPAGNVPIEVELASGARFTEHTDERGNLVFTIPKNEPARGVVFARAESQVAELKYRRKSELAMRPESLEE